MRRSVFLGTFLWGTILSLPIANNTNAASTTGTAVQLVYAAISVVNVSDLDFGAAPPGNPLKTVPPGTSENSANGSFTVTGQPSVAYTITLPASATMRTGAGAVANERITVNAFVSFPLAGANGLLGAGGTQSVFVGATRAALRPAQVVGIYTATYALTIVY